MMPALPKRMRVVRMAMAASNISGAVPAMLGKLWCSLTQKRW
jgi:hypothetical protein